MPCEHCLNRRQFLARTAGGAAVAAAIVACGDGALSNPNIVRVPVDSIPTGNNKLVITVADFPDLAVVGKLAKVSTFVAARRTGADTFEALSMACTHEGCLIDIVNAGQSFECPCHSSRFTNTGAVINGPNTGGAIGPLQKLPTSYDTATDALTIG
ncbi:MAG TPA: Rieske 2Fe-2S domain-containing protein [Gemmatimonadaceae bacterium]|nr:Rieske 2Fe-2S domain-containing protein [Gemmatimonadaceae bacterium]